MECDLKSRNRRRTIGPIGERYFFFGAGFARVALAAGFFAAERFAVFAAGFAPGFAAFFVAGFFAVLFVAGRARVRFGLAGASPSTPQI